MGRTSLKTLKETTLVSFFKVVTEQGLRPAVHYKYNEQKSQITFFNGSIILLKDLFSYPSDPNFDELGSLEITGAFVDECNQCIEKAWLILKSRIRHFPDESLVPKMLGTCNPSRSWVYNRFYQPSKSGVIPDNLKFIQSLLTDNPHISKHYKENLLQLDKTSKERLLYGNWEYSDDPTTLCDFDAIMDLFTNDHVLPIGSRSISSDLAMKGRDRFIAAPWFGLVCDLTKGVDKVKSDGKMIENDIKGLMTTHSVPHSRTIVDSDGMGNYLESYLKGIKEFHGNGKAYDAEFANIKSECGYKLAEMVNNREIKIICSSEQRQKISEEIGVLKADSVDKDEQRKRIIKKEKMKELLGRSPDYLDMLLMNMYFHIYKPAAQLYFE